MGAVRLRSVLSRGPPPWARDTGGLSQRFQLLVLGLGVAVLVLFVLVALLWRRGSEVEHPSTEQPDDVTAGEPDDVTAGEPDNVTAGEPDNVTAGEPDNVTAGKPDEYEQIRRINNTVEGRLPQQEIVRQTDWSEAKVSRVVSRLADEGRLRKVRVGRRNVIQLNDSDESDATEPQFGDGIQS